MAQGPVIMVKWTGQRLTPLAPHDDQLLQMADVGAMFRLEAATRRSNPQNALYWVMLDRVCEATGKWPTKEVLHRQLLIQCGYYTPVISLDGRHARLEADSTAFSAMRGDTFKGYFDRAIELLAEHTGIDPLALVQEAA